MNPEDQYAYANLICEGFTQEEIEDLELQAEAFDQIAAFKAHNAAVARVFELLKPVVSRLCDYEDLDAVADALEAMAQELDGLDADD